ncbi:MAG TPA: phenylalanine--tRNA ligase subunit alpha [Clostridiales bacterium]|nr:phenylalanine--tRNA ligase subunit alpha [Clostridiales bacterium]
MQPDIDRLREEALAAVAAAVDIGQLDHLQVAYLGRKGRLTVILRGLADVPAAERPSLGAMANQARAEIESALVRRRQELAMESDRRRQAAEGIDVTLPGVPRRVGRRHVLSAVRREIEEFFLHLGFSIAEGPEVELDHYNFELLNIPRGHPARETQDTFYLTDELLLRTHTSPTQIRVMQMLAPRLPVRVISPGRVYRRDSVDASHLPFFHQVEVLAVDRGITFADLKGTLEHFARSFFSQGTRVRLRPSYFPFTEPSAEVDVSCMCEGRGCSACGGKGWIELLGAGMVHPRVLEAGGYDPEEVSGYALGLGVERAAMLYHGINDIRLFGQNDVRFLDQFGEGGC